MVTGVLLCLLLCLTAVPALAAPAGEPVPAVQELAAAGGEDSVEEVSAVPVAALAVMGALALGCVGMAVYKTASKS